MSMVKVKFSGDCIGIFKGRSWFCTNHYCPKRGSKRSWLDVFFSLFVSIVTYIVSLAEIIFKININLSSNSNSLVG
jgi:hypothetical protein